MNYFDENSGYFYQNIEYFDEKLENARICDIFGREMMKIVSILEQKG